MARAATTADAFNAVAEPRRRQILDVLAGGERPVNDLVDLLGLAQPQVSKHLRVLREVGAVDVREEGRRRVYRLNGSALKPIHDWVKNYERLPEGVSEEEGRTVNTTTFTEADGRTTLTILVQTTSKTSRDAIIDSGMEAGLQDALDLLEQAALSLR